MAQNGYLASIENYRQESESPVSSQLVWQQVAIPDFA